jgi:hypothetical protein
MDRLTAEQKIDVLVRLVSIYRLRDESLAPVLQFIEPK